MSFFHHLFHNILSCIKYILRFPLNFIKSNFLIPYSSRDEISLRLLASIDGRMKREIFPASMQIINPSYLQAENRTILFSLVEFTINSSDSRLICNDDKTATTKSDVSEGSNLFLREKQMTPSEKIKVK